KMTAAERVKRDKKLIHDRLQGPLSWTSLALKYGLSMAQCQKIVKQWQQRTQDVSLDGVDPLHEIIAVLDGLDAQTERCYEYLATAVEQGNLGWVLACESRITENMLRRAALLQSVGKLPHELDTIRFEHKLRVIIERF